MAFKKGQSGNPGGRGTDKPWREAIMRAVRRKFEGHDDKALEKIADAVVLAAIGGDMQAAKEIGDRLDGKPAQAIVGDPDNPIKTHSTIEVRIVDPKN
jgi:hypothetical protein